MEICPICGQEFDPEDSKIPYSAIIADLNATLELKKGFKVTSEATKKLIRARWKEGHRFEDFQAVHKNMTAKWRGDPRMEQFLRPVTLYCASKFESYLNHKGKGSPSIQGEAERAVSEIMETFKDGRLRSSPLGGLLARVVYDAGGWVPLREYVNPHGEIGPEELKEREDDTRNKLLESYAKLA